MFLWEEVLKFMSIVKDTVPNTEQIIFLPIKE